MFLLLCVAPAFAATCPDSTVAITSGGNESTIVAPNSTGTCLSGYVPYESPDWISAIFTGVVLDSGPTLCGADQYLSNGTCTPLPQDRCDNDYVALGDSATVSAPNSLNICVGGYTPTAVPDGMYYISTGMVLSSGPTLCGSGQYMNNGTCTPYDSTKCPADWFDYAPSDTTFVPTVADSCNTGYGLTNDAIDCANRGGSDFCSTFCDSGYGVTWAGTCVQLCTAGVTELHVGNKVFPVYAEKTTSPALHIGLSAQDICYANVATGNADNTLNIKSSDGTIYHVTK